MTTGHKPRVLREGNSSRALEIHPRAHPSSLSEKEEWVSATVRPPDRESAATVYLVKWGWRAAEGEGRIVAAFRDRDGAERWLEDEAREQSRFWRNHPSFYSDMTSLPLRVLRDLVLDLGLEPPTLEECDSEAAWKAWCASQGPHLNDRQLQCFFDALDLWRLKGYTIVPVEFRE
jgi:hypothetical protein